ncbi:MAG: right-handed parallel beta-helix repeat-containing protein [Lentisphaeria bacterium]|nr:right-handed parallel beta-helix repeat-containing protein [Lentisphaeria bacterium]
MQNVKDFGAVGDGKTSDTKAIQRAIDAGGEVIFPPGIYKSGTLYLRSHGGLRLETGAILISGGEEETWNAPDFCPQNRTSEREKNNGRHLIVAYQCEDVSIRGGIIDGNFTYWLKEINEHNPYFKLEPRNGQLLFFCECRDVRVQDCTLRNGSYWHCFLHGCERITISGLHIHGDPRVLCNDGIDLDCCRFATVSDCVIETGDDAIAIRGNSKALGGTLRPTEHITVTNCVLASDFADGIRLGVGNGVIRNCQFSHIDIHHSGKGIEITSSYNGETGVDIENICFDNIFLEVLRPFKICLAAQLVGSSGVGMDVRSHIRNIDFRHIRGRAELTSEILGNPVGDISGLRFTDVRLDYYGKGPAPYLDERNRWCRESTASAFQFRNVRSAVFERLKINWCANQDLWLHEAEMENSDVKFNECELEKGTISK